MNGSRQSIFFSGNGDLHQAAKRRAAALGYSSFSRYIVSIIRLDAMEMIDHAKARKVASLPADNQQMIDAEILQKFTLKEQ